MVRPSFFPHKSSKFVQPEILWEKQLEVWLYQENYKQENFTLLPAKLKEQEIFSFYIFYFN